MHGHGIDSKIITNVSSKPLHLLSGAVRDLSTVPITFQLPSELCHYIVIESPM